MSANSMIYVTINGLNDAVERHCMLSVESQSCWFCSYNLSFTLPRTTRLRGNNRHRLPKYDGHDTN